MKSDHQFVIITGISGAGKSHVLKTFEELGYFCIDNLPVLLITKFAEICQQTDSNIKRVALVIDIREGIFFDDLFNELDTLKNLGTPYSILFLEASDDVLLRRFSETRRKHPLSGSGTVLDSIQIERQKLRKILNSADHVIDTSPLNVHELKDRIFQAFSPIEKKSRMKITINSFSYRYGIPPDSDLVFDVRFLPNPHYVEDLRPYTGMDKKVEEYVLEFPLTKNFTNKSWKLIEFLIPAYIKEGRAYLTISFGCTGGKHRSVVIANEFCRILLKKKYTEVTVSHRDIGWHR